MKFRWRFQYTVRTLLVITVLVAVPCSYVAWVRMRYAEQLRNAARLEELGARVFIRPRGKETWAAGPRKRDFLSFLLGEKLDREVLGVEIRGRDFSPEMARCIAKLPALQEFHIERSSFDGELLECLVHSPKLRSISLESVRTTEAAWECLGRLREVDDLRLNESCIDDDGIRNIGALKRLRRLELEATPVSDASVEIISQLPNLECLSLASTRVTDRCISQLCAIRTLKTLWLIKTNVTEAGAEKLAKAFPDARFQGVDMNRDEEGRYATW